MAADDIGKLEIFGHGTSRTMRPVWMAVEYGVPFKLHPVDPRSGETRTEAYLKLNPKHKVPTLRHGAFVLTESGLYRQARTIPPSCGTPEMASKSPR